MTPVRHAIVLRLAATTLLAAAGAAAEQAPPIPMAELRTLGRDQVARRPAATARGVVTFKWRQGMQSFAVQDGELSIWVSLPMARAEHVWAGDEALLAALYEGQEHEATPLDSNQQCLASKKWHRLQPNAIKLRRFRPRNAGILPMISWVLSLSLPVLGFSR